MVSNPKTSPSLPVSDICNTRDSDDCNHDGFSCTKYGEVTKIKNTFVVVIGAEKRQQQGYRT